MSSNILYSREVFTSNIERSLRLLKTDHIDLMQMHGLMPEYLPGGERDELMDLLADLKQQGKIRAIGATFRNGRKGQDFYPGGYGYLCADAFLGWKRIDTIQISYGGMMRTNEVAISRLAEAGFGVMARGTLRKYFEIYDQQFEASKISELFEEGEDRSDFLLRFALSHPALTAVVTGTSNAEHLKRNIVAANRGSLPVETYQEAKLRFNSVGMVPMP